MNTKILKISLLCAISGLLSACGPVYKTEFTYAPPASETGMMCLATCQASKTNCEQMEDIKKENCEARSEENYRHCLKEKERSQDKNMYCSRDYCNAYYERCANDYNTCYQTCGGQVIPHNVCIAFCN